MALWENFINPAGLDEFARSIGFYDRPNIDAAREALNPRSAPTPSPTATPAERPVASTANVASSAQIATPDAERPFTARAARLAEGMLSDRRRAAAPRKKPPGSAAVQKPAEDQPWYMAEGEVPLQKQLAEIGPDLLPPSTPRSQLVAERMGMQQGGQQPRRYRGVGEPPMYDPLNDTGPDPNDRDMYGRPRKKTMMGRLLRNVGDYFRTEFGMTPEDVAMKRAEIGRVGATTGLLEAQTGSEVENMAQIYEQTRLLQDARRAGRPQAEVDEIRARIRELKDRVLLDRSRLGWDQEYGRGQLGLGYEQERGANYRANLGYDVGMTNARSGMLPYLLMFQRPGSAASWAQTGDIQHPYWGGQARLTDEAFSPNPAYLVDRYGGRAPAPRPPAATRFDEKQYALIAQKFGEDAAMAYLARTMGPTQSADDILNQFQTGE